MNKVGCFFSIAIGSVSNFVISGRRIVGLFVIFLVASLSLPCSASDTGTIVGAVRDPSGAVVAHVTVRVSNPEKGFVRPFVTDSAGEYVARGLPIGNYIVNAEAPGFRRFEQSGITLTADETVRIDLQLKVGSSTQLVTVSGTVSRVETETGEKSQLITSTQIDNLAVNGRDYMSLFALVPGAANPYGLDPMQVGATGNENSTPFNGVRPESVNMQLDGTNISDTGNGGDGGVVSPPMSSIAELRVTTSNYGADSGERGGSQIQVVSKSGTTKFHGDMSEFVRNDAMDANDWFLNRQIAPPGGNAPKEPLKWNIFGFDIGGPIYIPGHYNTDKNKTFFFWSEEWAKYRQGVVLSPLAPSARMRTGDFSECDPKSPNANSVIISQGCNVPVNPLTGQAFSGDVVPMNSNAQDLLNGLFPLADNGVDGYITAPSLPTNWHNDQVRIDENISEATSAFFRFTREPWTSRIVPSLWAGAVYDTVANTMSIPGDAASFHVVHTFSPTLTNEFIEGFSQNRVIYLPAVGPSNVAGSIDKPSNWSVQPMFAANAAQPLLPGVTVCGGTPFCVSENTGAGPFINANPVISLRDSISKVVGKHLFIVGASYFRSAKNQTDSGSSLPVQGVMTFSTSSTVTTGNSLADLDLGRMGNYTEGVLTNNGVPVGGTAKYHFRFIDLEPFVQDNWKVTPRLTLNLGVRYQYFTPFKDFTNPVLSSNFIPSQYNPAIEAPLNSSGYLVPNSATGQVSTYTAYGNGLVACGVGNIEGGCVVKRYDDVAPRFGFSWDPFGHGTTTIKGGYGIFYDIGDPDDGDAEAIQGNPPTQLVLSAYNLAGYQNIAPGPLGAVTIGALKYNEKNTYVQPEICTGSTF
jgi:hypothetical protein